MINSVKSVNEIPKGAIEELENEFGKSKLFLQLFDWDSNPYVPRNATTFRLVYIEHHDTYINHYYVRVWTDDGNKIVIGFTSSIIQVK